MGGKRGTLIKLFVANVLISLLWASKRLNEILEVSNFFYVDGQWLQFWQESHVAYSNGGAQVGA